MIVFENVVKEYDNDDEKVAGLKGVSFNVDKGEFVFIVGNSGSGKSTILKLLLREIKPTSGDIYINGTHLNKVSRTKLPYIRRNMGVVFQNFRLLPDRNVYDNVAFAQKVIEAPEDKIKSKVFAMLSMVGLIDKVDSFPSELSGGEQQRVAIARALVNDPMLLLCDEPTGNLDPENSWEVMKVLEEANSRGTTILMVTHNHDIVNAMHKRVITMSGGLVLEDEKRGIGLYEV